MVLKTSYNFRNLYHADITLEILSFRRKKKNEKENSGISAFIGGYYKNILAPSSPLRKHAYSNVLKISPPKNENFQIKNCYIFQISAQNIDCGYSLELPRGGGSNEYPQSMFLSRNKKNNV